jgi:hypothetical protein
LFQHARKAITPIFVYASKTAQLDSLLKAHPGKIFLLSFHIFDDTDRGWLILAEINRQALDGTHLKRLTCGFPSNGYSVFAKSDREFAATSADGTRLVGAEVKATNLLRWAYGSQRPPRHYGLVTVGPGSTPCPDGHGELEAKLR